MDKMKYKTPREKEYYQLGYWLGYQEGGREIQGYIKGVMDVKERVDKLQKELGIESTDGSMEEEDCPVCHGQGATTDHHDPCTECGGSGKVGGED